MALAVQWQCKLCDAIAGRWFDVYCVGGHNVSEGSKVISLVSRSVAGQTDVGKSLYLAIPVVAVGHCTVL